MPAKYEKIEVTKEMLDSNPNMYFVFGDNLTRTGTGGAAKLRHHPRAIGFITKKEPTHNQTACFTPEEYASIFFQQLEQLREHIKKTPTHTFYISKIGSGLANKYWIWEKLIHHNLRNELNEFDNVVFCWSLDDENLPTK